MDFSVDSVTPDMENEVASSNLIPEGEHRAYIAESEYSRNKVGNGEYLKLTIVPEKYPTRKLWHYFNIKHEKPQAELFGKVELKKVLIALGMTGFTNHEELRGHMVNVTIKHEKDNQDSSRLRERIVLWARDKDSF